MVRMDRITLEKKYSWPSPTRRRSLLRSFVSVKESFAPPAESSPINARHYDSVPGIDPQNSREHLQSVLESGLGGTDLDSRDMTSRTISPETDLEGATIRVADGEETTGRIQRGNQKRKKNTRRTTGSGEHRIGKKRASVSRRQVFEYSRLGAIRSGVEGRIQFRIYWKPTWGTLEDLRGTRALKEAEELIVNEYDEVTWDEEMLSPAVDVDLLHKPLFTTRLANKPTIDSRALG
ncbi:hypothetical protein MAC_03249 [Metarhizium acridum CQMa 102]|uniref:Chromo domain-containing protein n=1 Tax=Metarhizium acridum (strain CQMa 102) TaxID=655827 RepID=E9E066_METAQ|nr:uncharacterized protein MAC_03247 [Metarhizium acridum CQMa 102]XP_007809589.1 uncharacterized protein MAC_03249 [Metarhizium acridum CQMa 102]EFY90667.1 hypothetical protein MAC_03247 [Metarhizium acridum CQMa 102]EFY90669.1 hypothetical protein MAC_03249 [Metarhizium acridum CQMa 102]